MATRDHSSSQRLQDEGGVCLAGAHSTVSYGALVSTEWAIGEVQL